MGSSSKERVHTLQNNVCGMCLEIDVIKVETMSYLYLVILTVQKVSHWLLNTWNRLRWVASARGP